MMRSLLTAVVLSSLVLGAHAAPSKARKSPQAAGYLAFLAGTRTAGAPVLTFNLGVGARSAGYLAFLTAAQPALAAVKPVTTPAKSTAATTSSLSAVAATSAPAIQAVSLQQAPALVFTSVSQPSLIQTGGSTPTAVQTSGGRPTHPPVVILPPPANDQPIYSYP